MSGRRPVLVVVGGLPATGKSTIAEHVARLVGAPYLRVDRIEQAIVAHSSLEHPIGPAGYAVAYALAREQLTLRLDVIVECVNPIALTRDGWVATAADVDASIAGVEVICSDLDEHRRRVQTRATDVDGLVKPHLVIDSARTPPDQAPRQTATTIVAEGEEPSPA